MILNFKPQFKGLILNGTKIHSIRADQYYRWKPGMVIHFATGSRTKFYNQFWYGHCKSVQTVRIIHWNWGEFSVEIDGRSLSFREIDKFAQNDGFEYWAELREWFVPDAGTVFGGTIIHWTNKRY